MSQLPIISATNLLRFDEYVATRAESDSALVGSWLTSMGSAHSQRGCAMIASRLLAALSCKGLTLRSARIEDVRDAIDSVAHGVSRATRRQYTLRCKSLLSYAYRLGYLPFNLSAAIRVGSARGAREASIVQRRLSESEVARLIHAPDLQRDQVLLILAYVGGLRISELVNLTWGDVCDRQDGQIQLSIMGKGEYRRQVLLPAAVGDELRFHRSSCVRAEASAPVISSMRNRTTDCGPARMSERGIHARVKHWVKVAGLNPRVSCHWLRHAHATHSLERGATLLTVQATLGHSNIATTSAYLHARPDVSSGQALDERLFRR